MSKKYLTNIVFASAIFAGGYFCGTKNNQINNPSLDIPIAQGFLDIPHEYQLSIRANSYNEREVYLQNKEKNLEWPLIEQSVPLIESYMGNGKYVMQGAMTTVSASRKMLSLGGADIYTPKKIEQK